MAELDNAAEAVDWSRWYVRWAVGALLTLLVLAGGMLYANMNSRIDQLNAHIVTIDALNAQRGERMATIEQQAISTKTDMARVESKVDRVVDLLTRPTTTPGR